MNTAEIKRENHINLYNEKGERHGVWESYHDNGQLSYRGSYVNGKSHGVWESYYDTGQLYYRGSYVNGKSHGVWESYYDTGQLHYRKEYDMGNEVKPVVELTMDEIAERFNIPVNQLKIKKGC